MRDFQFRDAFGRMVTVSPVAPGGAGPVLASLRFAVEGGGDLVMPRVSLLGAMNAAREGAALAEVLAEFGAVTALTVLDLTGTQDTADTVSFRCPDTVSGACPETCPEADTDPCPDTVSGECPCRSDAGEPRWPDTVSGACPTEGDMPRTPCPDLVSGAVFALAGEHPHWGWRCLPSEGGCGYESPWLNPSPEAALAAFEAHRETCRPVGAVSSLMQRAADADAAPGPGWVRMEECLRRLGAVDDKLDGLIDRALSVRRYADTLEEPVRGRLVALLRGLTDDERDEPWAVALMRVGGTAES